MKSFLFAVLTLITPLCMAGPSNKTTEVRDIREATFRFQMSKWVSYQKKPPANYYLEVVPETDPDDTLVQRFAGHQPPVKKRSDCRSSTERGVFDKKSRQRGVLFVAGSIQWKSATEVELNGDAYDARPMASGTTYHLKKKNGKWRVTKATSFWVS